MEGRRDEGMEEGGRVGERGHCVVVCFNLLVR